MQKFSTVSFYTLCKLSIWYKTAVNPKMLFCFFFQIRILNVLDSCILKACVTYIHRLR